MDQSRGAQTAGAWARHSPSAPAASPGGDRRTADQRPADRRTVRRRSGEPEDQHRTPVGLSRGGAPRAPGAQIPPAGRRRSCGAGGECSGRCRRRRCEGSWSQHPGRRQAAERAARVLGTSGRGALTQVAAVEEPVPATPTPADPAPKEPTPKGPAPAEPAPEASAPMGRALLQEPAVRILPARTLPASFLPGRIPLSALQRVIDLRLHLLRLPRGRWGDHATPSPGPARRRGALGRGSGHCTHLPRSRGEGHCLAGRCASSSSASAAPPKRTG